MTQSLESVRPDNQPDTLQDAWVEFASKFEPFDLYLTLTFKEEIHPEQASKRYHRFIRKVNESLWGRRYREQGRGIYWIRALEWQKRGVLHFHCLIGGGAWKLLRIGVTNLWENDKKYKTSMYGENGKAWVERYNPLLGAKNYLAKYISKGGELDIFIPTHIKEHLGIIPDANTVLGFLANDRHPNYELRA